PYLSMPAGAADSGSPIANWAGHSAKNPAVCIAPGDNRLPRDPSKTLVTRAIDPIGRFQAPYGTPLAKRLTAIPMPPSRELASTQASTSRAGNVQQENIGLKLLEAHVITPEALQKAQLQVKTGGGNLMSALIKLGAVKED